MKTALTEAALVTMLLRTAEILGMLGTVAIVRKAQQLTGEKHPAVNLIEMRDNGLCLERFREKYRAGTEEEAEQALAALASSIVGVIESLVGERTTRLLLDGVFSTEPRE
jgi:hypothetical protein